MNKRHRDIGDDEIRVISADGGGRRRRNMLYVWLSVAVALLAAGVLAVAFFSSDVPSDQDSTSADKAMSQDAFPDIAADAYTEVRDTVVGGVGLIILTPVDATPGLEVGRDVLGDSTAVLVAQAADIRGDNGEIVGAYVVRGELLGKGEAKAGFCSIIDGRATVGVADASPMLEQALTTGGYFFRQYPLVVGGQVVENKPRGKARRKALAEIDGTICVIMSTERLTFHDFSQALVDAGVSNAIYLVGADSSGFYRDVSGSRVSIGNPSGEWGKNVNYIVWR